MGDSGRIQEDGNGSFGEGFLCQVSRGVVEVVAERERHSFNKGWTIAGDWVDGSEFVIFFWFEINRGKMICRSRRKGNRSSQWP